MKAIGYGIGLAGCVLAATWANIAGTNAIGAIGWGLICLLGLLFTKGEK